MRNNGKNEKGSCASPIVRVGFPLSLFDLVLAVTCKQGDRDSDRWTFFCSWAAAPWSIKRACDLLSCAVLASVWGAASDIKALAPGLA